MYSQFILLAVLRQVHSLFIIEFCTVSTHIFLLVFLSLLLFLMFSLSIVF